MNIININNVEMVVAIGTVKSGGILFTSTIYRTVILSMETKSEKRRVSFDISSL